MKSVAGPPAASPHPARDTSPASADAVAGPNGAAAANLAVRTVNLSKEFGSVAALKGIDLVVPHGAIYGFIGANGAGKTTAIRILFGLASASSGYVEVLGHRRGELPATPIPGLAYLPDAPNLSPWMSADETLIFLAGLSGVPEDIAAEKAPGVLRFVGLDRVRHASIGGFSRGMKQRLGIACALIGEPQLLILDEPTSALDPLGRSDLLSIISQLRGVATVIFSSHFLADVEHVCTHIGMLDRGELLMQGELAEIMNRHAAPISRIHLDIPTEQIPHVTAGLNRYLSEEHIDARLSVTGSTLQEIYEAHTAKRAQEGPR